MIGGQTGASASQTHYLDSAYAEPKLKLEFFKPEQSFDRNRAKRRVFAP
jgi:hypothetical protein